MSILSIESPEKELSYILRKNPNTGMIAKRLRKGSLFGFYENNQTYRLCFFDDSDEISFGYKKNQNFEYLDSTRYYSPEFVMSALNAMCDSAMSGSEEDHPGIYSITIESIKIKKNKIFEFIKYFDGFDFELIPLIQNVYTVKIYTSTRTLKDLLQLSYIMSFFISAQNGNDVSKELNSTKKIIKFCNDLKTPYFAKYLIKMYSIKNTNDFAKVKELLEYNEEYTFKFTYGSNSANRFEQIKNRIDISKDIVDFGCGEGMYLKLCEKVKNYYAIDKNEESLDKVNKKIKTHEYENVYVLNDIYDFLESDHDSYNLIMTEVFEHNDLNTITKTLNDILMDDKCYKIIFTTPNKDFNQFYLMEKDELRHPDHVFEMREQELEDYFKNFPIPIYYKIKHLGDEVNNISTSLLVEISKKG